MIDEPSALEIALPNDRDIGRAAKVKLSVSRPPTSAWTLRWSMFGGGVVLPWTEADVEPTTVNLLVTGHEGRLCSGDLFDKAGWHGSSLVMVEAPTAALSMIVDLGAC